MEEKPFFKSPQEKRNFLILFPITCIGLILFFISYYKQEEGITDKLNECSFYTIISPIRMPDSIKLYFSFSHDGNTINSSSSVGAGDLGAWYSMNQVLNSRFFIRVNCDDFQVNRVLWDIPVPDTLQHAPPKGWDKIPYD